jgi:hypothetical protein
VDDGNIHSEIISLLDVEPSGLQHSNANISGAFPINNLLSGNGAYDVGFLKITFTNEARERTRFC